MATYIVTTSNWDNAAFWSSISQAGPGHTLDFSGLPSTFEVDFWPGSSRIIISNGTTDFIIGDSDYAGTPNVEMGGSTQLEYFTTIHGSQGNDVSDGGANADTIFGNSGNDTLSGNGGTDSLEGNSGNDELYGGAGNDTLKGGDGTDVLEGGSGNDSLYGDGGNDVLRGGDGADRLEGGSGNDFLYGGTGNDTILGGDGNDLFQGQEGNDSIGGGAGQDSIYESNQAGIDQIDGGSDNDALIFVSNTPIIVTFTGLETGSYLYTTGGGASGTFTDIENFQSGTGQDTLDFSGLTNGLTATYSGSVSGTITGGSDTITFAGFERMILTGLNDVVNATSNSSGTYIDAGAGNDSVTGGGGNDTIFGGSGSDTINSGAGNDSVLGGDDNDRIDGGSGDDTIFGGAGNDTLTGNSGNDFIYAGDGNDIIWTSSGNDYIEGGAGNDIFAATSSGNDQLFGGDGADRFNIQDGAGNLTISGGEGGTDNDFIDLSQMTGAVTVTYTGDEAGTIVDGSDTITFLGIEKIVMTDFDDEVDGRNAGIGANFDLGAGNDIAFGTFGDDSIQGGDGDDFIDSWAGKDTIDGGAGNDTVLGGSEDDLVMGGDGDDFLQGWTGNDTLQGGAGNDTLETWEGNELLEGGDDADTFLVTNNTGNDTIIGGEGASDDDVIDLSSLGGGVTVNYSGNEAGSISDGSNTINFSQIERLVLTEQNDVVDAADDSVGVDIEAGDGDDTITDGSGNDRIDAGDGDDYIAGNDGDDTFFGGAGNDDIEGGDGSDSIDGGDGDDFIAGYDVSGLAAHSHGVVSDDGAADTLEGGAGNDTLLGGGGNDLLDGGEGNDSLVGGSGDDLFVFSGGQDTIADFNTGNSGALGDGDPTNNDFIDLSQYYTDMAELGADFADDGVLNQSSGDYSDNTSMLGGSMEFSGANHNSFSSDNTGVVCFTTGTAIRTPRGDVLIEDLQVGDLVVTADNGPQPIRWIGTRHLDRQTLLEAPNLRPILFNAEVVGNTRPLLVSPQHCMMLGSKELVRAKHLAEKLSGVRIAHGKRSVCYVHLMFDTHQIIFAENAPSESFYPGPMSLKMINEETRQELFHLFPELERDQSCRTLIERTYGAPARDVIKKRDLAEVLAASKGAGLRSGLAACA